MQSASEDKMMTNPSTTFTGTVEKIIKSRVSTEPERAQIVVEGADDLYKELRIENSLTDADGKRVPLQEGTKVHLTVEAEAQGLAKVVPVELLNRAVDAESSREERR